MNAFGSASQKFPLVDARDVREARVRHGRGPMPGLGRANSLYVPCGRRPVRGWLLLARADYDLLDHYADDLQWEVGDPRRPDNVGTIKNLSIVQAQCATRGIGSDEDAVYLVEVTDQRGVAHNGWFQAPLTAAYNIRAPAYPQVYHSGSLNGGAPWTWATMLADVWAKVGAGTGNWPAWPGLAAGVSVSGVPEGFWFTGVPAWPSLCDVLAHLGLAVAADLTAAAPYTVVSDGADDPALTALQAKYLTNLRDDAEWIDVGSGRVPGTVEVLFRRRNAVYGTEETVRRDGLQWSMQSYYSVSVAAPAAFAGATGTHHIWDDFTIRADQDGNWSAADAAEAATIAAERVVQYFDRVYSRTSGYMRQLYAGALPFATGSQVDGVCWRHGPRGWETEIARDDPPFPGVWD